MKKTLGQTVRELRQGLGISLRQLGEGLMKLGHSEVVSAAFLSDLENGRRFPSDKMLELLARALRVPPEELKQCDQRPTKDVQELVEMNVQYGFSFRRIAQLTKENNISPEELVRRVENGGNE